MEFLEDGGVLTLLDILSHAQSKEQDKTEALRLLLTVSNTGRKYKEIICESHGKFQNAKCTFYHIQYTCGIQCNVHALCSSIVYVYTEQCV